MSPENRFILGSKDHWSRSRSTINSAGVGLCTLVSASFLSLPTPAAMLFLVASVCFITHHRCIAAGVGRAFSRVCLSVCPRSKRKVAWATNTKLGTRILQQSLGAHWPRRSKCKRLKSHSYENRHGRTVASDACCYGRCRRECACRYDCLCFLVDWAIDRTESIE